MANANEKITDQVKTKLAEISEAIRSGSASAEEFQMPFGGLTGSPHNVDTGHHATGSNALLCWIYGVSHYSTYDGWLRVGYQVTTPADFHLVKPKPVTYEKENKQTGETETHTFCRFSSFPVWAAASVTLRTAESDAKTQAAWDARAKRTGKPAKQLPPMPQTPWSPPVVERRPDVELQQEVKQYLANTGAAVNWIDGDRACYMPSLDEITLPLPDRFRDTKTATAAQNLASTALHELGHWTGHSSRMNRKLSQERKAYSQEELIAEGISAILCARLGVESTMRIDHAQYIASWLQALGNDHNFIFNSGAHIAKAIEYLDALQPTQLDQAA